MVRCFPYVFRRVSPSEMIFNASATSKRKDNSPQARLPWTCRRQLLYEPHWPMRDALTSIVPHITVSEFWSEFPFPHCEGREFRRQTLPKKNPPTLKPPIQSPFQGGFPRGLGPTYPCPSTVHTETYSASVFCVNLINRIIATTTKICTRYAISRRLTPNASTRAPRPPTRLWCCWLFIYQ